MDKFNESKKVGVAQKAILFRSDGRFLSIRRTKTAPTRPLGWDLPGGELDYGEDARTGMQREIQEETGLKAENLEVFDIVSGFNPINEFWVTICYVGKLNSTNVVLSYEHDDLKWVTPEEFMNLPGISSRHAKFIEKMHKRNG